MVTRRYTKKHAERVVIIDNNERTLVYYPLEKKWEYGDGREVNGAFVEINIDGQDLRFNTKQGVWYQSDYSRLHELAQQQIRRNLVRIIERCNPFIQELRSPKRRNKLISVIIREMHHFGEEDNE